MSLSEPRRRFAALTAALMACPAVRGEVLRLQKEAADRTVLILVEKRAALAAIVRCGGALNGVPVMDCDKVRAIMLDDLLAGENSGAGKLTPAGRKSIEALLARITRSRPLQTQ